MCIRDSLLIATHLMQLNADAFHLVGKGALLAAQGLSDAAVGIRVELLKALEQLLQKCTVGIDLFHADGFGKLSVKKRAIVVGVRCLSLIHI